MVVCEWVFFVVCVWGGEEREKKNKDRKKGEKISSKNDKKKGKE